MSKQCNHLTLSKEVVWFANDIKPYMGLNKHLVLGYLSWVYVFLIAQYNSFLFIQDIIDAYIIIVVYVDDIIIIGSSSYVIDNLIFRLHSIFALKNLGTLNYFMGLKVVFHNNLLHLKQPKYVKE